jgi:hypothetical protein
MHLLPDPLAALLTWALCALLLGLALRDWIRAQVAFPGHLVLQARRHLQWPDRTATGRWRGMVNDVHERNGQLYGEDLTIFSLSRCLRGAMLAAPFALIAAKALTGERVLGLFAVFRDDPGAVERVGRCLLVVLVFAAAVRGFPRLDAWLDRTAARGGRWPMVRALFWVALFLPFVLVGLTSPLVVFFGLMVLVAGFMSIPSTSARMEEEYIPFVHAGIQAVASGAILAVLVPLHLLGKPLGGYVAVALMAGLLLPLAVAPALFVTLRGAGALIYDAAHGNFGARAALRAAGHALLGLGLLAAGLTAALWLSAVLAPAGYRPDLSAIRAGLWSDPALAGAIWVLAGVVLLPLLAIPAEGVAREIIYHSPQLRRATAMVAARAPSTSVVRAMVAAYVLGWGGTMLLLGLPALALAVAWAGR